MKNNKSFLLIILSTLLLLKFSLFQSTSNKAINTCGRKDLRYNIPNSKEDCKDPFVKNKYCCFVEVYQMKFCALLSKNANNDIKDEFNEKLNIKNEKDKIKIQCN